MFLLYFQGETENKFMQIGPLGKFTIVIKTFSYMSLTILSFFPDLSSGESGWLCNFASSSRTNKYTVLFSDFFLI